MPNLTDSDVATAAQALYQAELDNIPITPISETYPNADVDDAYRISQAVTALKVAGGRVIKGHKIGLTSKAMRSADQRHRARLRHDVRQLVHHGRQRHTAQHDEPPARRGRVGVRAEGTICRARRSRSPM